MRDGESRFMDWTDETIARLRELWGQGLPTAEIGRQLEITKNAVVGKAHRLGLPPRPSPIRNRKADGSADAPQRKPPARSRQAPKDAPAASKPDSAAVVSASQTPVAQTAVTSAVHPPDAVAPSLKETAPSARVNTKKVVRVMSSDGVQSGELQSVAKAPHDTTVHAAPTPSAKVTTAARSDKPVVSEDAVTTPPRNLSSVVGQSGAQRMVSPIDRPARRGPSCCWPFGDPGTPGFHFCGAKPLPGKPYCAEHAAIAYVKIRDRRD